MISQIQRGETTTVNQNYCDGNCKNLKFLFSHLLIIFNQQEVNQDDAQTSELLQEKHIAYVVNQGNDKNDFVSFTFNRLQLILIDLIFKGIHNDRVSTNEWHLLGHNMSRYSGPTGKA